MGNNVSLDFQNAVKSFLTSAYSVMMESADIYKLYFSAGPSSEISGYGNNDAVTVATKLTKADMVAGITLCEQLNNFFDGSAVSQADYLATIENLLYGSAVLATAISPAVEAVGSRLYSLSGTLLAMHQEAKSLLKIYTESLLSAAVAAVNTETVFFGCDATKAEFSSGVTLVEQLNRMLTNLSVTTATYSSTLAKWDRL